MPYVTVVNESIARNSNTLFTLAWCGQYHDIMRHADEKSAGDSMATNIDKTELLNRILSDAGQEPLSDNEKGRNALDVKEDNDFALSDESEVESVGEEQTESSERKPESGDAETVDDKSGEATEPAESPEPTADAAEKPSNQSKEVRKIIDLKAENKALRKELEEFREAKRKAELVSQYGETYDEDTAKARADSDIRAERMERRIELAEFKADNATILVQFPEARADAEHIFEVVKSSGMTVEQVCRGLYGDAEPLDIRRAKAAANGSLPKSETATPNVSKAVNSSNTPNKDSMLTADERKTMDRLNSVLPPDATRITEKEMLERRKRVSR